MPTCWLSADRSRDAASRVATHELPHLFLVRSTGQIVRLGAILAAALGLHSLCIQQVQHQRVVVGAFRVAVGDAVEILRPPLVGGVRVHEQARRILGPQASTLVHDLLASAAIEALVGTELELTRRVVARVANHATPVEDRLDVFQEAH